MFGQGVLGRVVAGRMSDLWVVDSAFQLVYDNFVLFEVSVVVAFIADAVVFVGGKIGTQFVDLFKRQLLGDAHLALFLPPFLVVKLYNSQILELQLLLFAATTRLFLLLAVFFVVRVEVMLLILSKRVPLSCAVNVEVTQLEHRSTKRGNLLEIALSELWQLELFL